MRLTTTPCSCGRTCIRFHVLGRSDDMFIVRGINVFPLAVAAIVDEFRPLLTGEFRIVLDEPPPLSRHPVSSSRSRPTCRPERLAASWVATGGSGPSRRSCSRAAVEIVPAGTYPRGEQKTRRLIRAYLGER